MMFKQYLQVTKPGIIFGNLISVIGGFLLASKGSIDYPLFIYTLVGVSLVVASGCVFNNYIDRDIDRKMERTKNRVLVKGLISPAVSLVYATLLGIAGFMLLWFGANPLACWLGVMGFVVYVGVYSLYMKRHSVYGTLIGSLSGAAPPVIGYCAVTGEFDSGAAILLAIFSLWQMPHSYAIAIFRFKDYQAANIPVLPVVKGISVAKNHITLYIIAFAVATLMLSLGGYAGYKYLVVAAAVSVWWLGMALRGYKVADDRIWARKLSIRELIRASLRMRPDRVIVGEVRGGEAIDMLQAMNTGHDGSMSTGHANSAQDMLNRLETMVLMGMELPLAAIRKQIASGIDIIVQLGRLRDKTRKVLQIMEVTGVEQGEILLSPLYLFEEKGEEDGRIVGTLQKKGELFHREKMESAGIRMG